MKQTGHLSIRPSGNPSSQKIPPLYENVSSIPKIPKYKYVYVYNKVFILHSKKWNKPHPSWFNPHMDLPRETRHSKGWRAQQKQIRECKMKLKGLLKLSFEMTLKPSQSTQVTCHY